MRKHAILALSAIALIAAATPSLAASPKSASEFLSGAMKGDNSEIKLGTLAQNKGSSAGIRHFGQTLVADHTQAKRQVGDLEKSMDVAPTDDVMPEADAEYNKLQAISGTSFDHEFATYMVSDHEKDIAEFEAQTGASDKTAALAKKQLPTLRKHLHMAESLAR